MSQDVAMMPPTEPGVPTTAPPKEEPRYGGFTRFEIELEFVQCLANPFYLNHLAAHKYLSRPEFIAYLDYLQYWSQPPYVNYLTYPGPTLRHLDLLQRENFRRDILSPDLVERLLEEGTKASVAWHTQG
ncbi:related to SOH1 protein [Cephalotrichum gorgonifer]|uniref:Mediator of RNA polymerase II transcription subunit 31 n=1 Tax=Cephalotrichum gorgonifer TaxID=2041049 RepID=A0AAE8SWK1_9PEZI|nr:related to SOH1 protein [Cephalotrichum gorgonifer]